MASLYMALSDQCRPDVLSQHFEWCRIPTDLNGQHQTECQPASVGEFWYDEFVRGLLNSTCKEECSKIQVSRHIAEKAAVMQPAFVLPRPSCDAPPWLDKHAKT